MPGNTLQHRTALICGSSQGIGLAIAQALAAQGAVCILFARNADSLKKAVAQLPASVDQQHRFIVADFADPQQVKQAVEKELKETAIHILVNNTGGPKPGPITEADPSAFVAAFNQHVVNNQMLAQLLLPGMKSNGFGRIINIVSTSVRIPLENLGVSNTIRAAVAGWAKSWSNEVAQFGITVNNILPGLTATQRLDGLVAATAKAKGADDDVVREQLRLSVPAKRFADASEIAALAVFLASPAAGYINGTSIPVDGGRTGSI